MLLEISGRGDCTIRVAKTKELITFAVTAKLICVFVFSHAKSRFSHDEAHFNRISHKKSQIFLNSRSRHQDVRLHTESGQMAVCSLQCIFPGKCKNYSFVALNKHVYICNISCSCNFLSAAKVDNFQMKKCDYFFLILAQNIDCDPQSMF